MMAWILRRSRHVTDEHLSAYADGSLDAVETRKVEAHLPACDGDCARRLEGLRTTAAILRSVSAAQAPRSFALRPEQLYRQTPPMRATHRSSPVPVLAPALAATAAAVVFAVLLVGNITGAIQQSGDARDAGAAVSEEREVVQSLAATGPQGPAGPAGSPGEAEAEVARLEEAEAEAPGDATQIQTVVIEQEADEKHIVETVVVEKVEKEVAEEPVVETVVAERAVVVTATVEEQASGEGEVVEEAPVAAQEAQAPALAEREATTSTAAAAPTSGSGGYGIASTEEAPERASPIPDTSRLTLPVTPTSQRRPVGTPTAGESPDGAEDTMDAGPTPAPGDAEAPVPSTASPGPTVTPRPRPTSAPTTATGAPAPTQPAEEAERFFDSTKQQGMPPAESEALAAPAAGEESLGEGVSLPVWQLEVLFGALAVVFGGLAAALIRRRRSSS